MKQFQKLPVDERYYVMEYLEEFTLYELVKSGSQRLEIKCRS